MIKPDTSKPPRFTPYKTVQGDRFDLIANLAYENVTGEDLQNLISDNKHLAIKASLPGGVDMYIRIKVDPVTGEDLPPWKLAPVSGEVGGGGTGVDPSIPVVVTPPVALAFSPGFPRVVGSKIEFAINRSQTYPYSVEKVSGGSVSSSPGYLFAAGFPVSTLDIVDGGQYLVKVGTLVSAPLTVIGTALPLGFSVAPYFDTDENGLPLIKYSINATGNFLVKIIRKSDNVVVYTSTDAHTKEVLESWSVLGDLYTIQVGTLSADVNTNIVETLIKPIYLILMGYSFDYLTREFSFYAQTLGDAEVSIERQDGLAMVGKSFDNLSWVNRQYVPGTNSYASYIPPFSEAFPFNPVAPGSGGLDYNVPMWIRMRLSADRNSVFKFPITLPQHNVPFYQVIDLEPDPGEETACTRGPNINSAVTVVSVGGIRQLQFKYDAEDVFKFTWRIKSLANAVLDTGDVDMVDEFGHNVWSPGNVPRITPNLDLDPGTYKLQIRGKGCFSEWLPVADDRTFVIVDDEEEPEPPIVTGPITPKKLGFSFRQHIDLNIAGSSEDWTISDVSAENPGPGYENYYVINEVIKRGAKLTNYKYESNRSLIIYRYMIRINEPDLSQLGDGATDRIQHFSQNATSGYVMIDFNEF